MGKTGGFNRTKKDNPLIREAIDKYNYDYGVQLVKKGYIVFCPDARGFGERREIPSQGGEEKLTHHIFSGGHQWNGDKVEGFLKKYL